MVSALITLLGPRAFKNQGRQLSKIFQKKGKAVGKCYLRRSFIGKRLGDFVKKGKPWWEPSDTVTESIPVWGGEGQINSGSPKTGSPKKGLQEEQVPPLDVSKTELLLSWGQQSRGGGVEEMKGSSS